MTEGILDIVAEHPQEQHVAAEMKNVRMQKGIGHVAEVRRNDDKLRRQFRSVMDDGRDEAVAECRARREIVAGQSRRQIDGDIQNDQPDRHIGVPNATQVVRIVKRNEHAAGFRPLGVTSATFKSAVFARHP